MIVDQLIIDNFTTCTHLPDDVLVETANDAMMLGFGEEEMYSHHRPTYGRR